MMNRTTFTIVLLWNAAMLTPLGLRGQASIDMSGRWRFAADREDHGLAERWWEKSLADTAWLPGSMAGNGKGDEVSPATHWTGGIVDHSWFTAARFARYREEGNIKLPFWLTPVRVYLGAAWYQKEVTVPPGWKRGRVVLHLGRVHWESMLWVDQMFVGMRNSLAVPHEYEVTTLMKPGRHTVTVRVDNRIKDVDIGRNAHSITDHTQTNWNGIIGEIALRSVPGLSVEDVRIEPDVVRRKLNVEVTVAGVGTDAASNPRVAFRIVDGGVQGRVVVRGGTVPVRIVAGRGKARTSIPLGESVRLWDEFDPALYVLEVSVSVGGKVLHGRRMQFGVREFKVNGTRFEINGRPVFLRGTLDFCIFPQSGYPSMHPGEWEREFRIVRSFGMNHVRFHSWCPPEAAFDAADKLGLYLQVECGTWCKLGEGEPIDGWLYEESERIVRAYGNHPSFCMLASGNEPSGAGMAGYLGKFVSYWKEKDRRRVYTSAAGWPQLPENDFHSSMYPRIQVWGMGLSSIINREPPQTVFDFRDTVGKYERPVVAHETGQWCAYPNLKEIDKYHGVLRAGNFEIIRDDLEAKGLLPLAGTFLVASGKLQVLCYKADIEAALRTPGMAGFQLLGLHDFPGQGTAPVGVLDVFSDAKGYIDSASFSRFCGPTVPLARMNRLTYTDADRFEAAIEVAHFGKTPLKEVSPEWMVSTAAGRIVRCGRLNRQDIGFGNATSLGHVGFSLEGFLAPARYRFSVRIGEAENDWDFWVYPEDLPAVDSAGTLVTAALDSAAGRLRNGGSVLLVLGKGRVSKKCGGEVALGFSSIFWNTAWTSGQAPHTLGILCDPSHPALAEFPTEFYSDWQWWDLIAHADAMILDSISHALRPIVRVVDDWQTNRQLALLVEARVGAGRLLLCSIDLLHGLDRRPEARQFRHSLLRYMNGPLFRPDSEVSYESLQKIVGR